MVLIDLFPLAGPLPQIANESLLLNLVDNQAAQFIFFCNSAPVRIALVDLLVVLVYGGGCFVQASVNHDWLLRASRQPIAPVHGAVQQWGLVLQQELFSVDW